MSFSGFAGWPDPETPLYNAELKGRILLTLEKEFLYVEFLCMEFLCVVAGVYL